MSKENSDKKKDKSIHEIHSKQSKKHLRFDPQEPKAKSDESLYSHPEQEGRDERVNVPGTSNVSVLKSSIWSPNYDAGKVPQANPCFTKNSYEEAVTEEGEAVLPSKSSQQLFVITKKSPIPSDPDLKLIAWTHLRKLEGVKDAIRHGANVNTLKDGRTPLLISTEIGAHRLVAYLLRVPNVNPDTPNMFGETPLLIAVRNAFVCIIKLLLHHNANVNKADNMGRTPLQLALFQKRPQLAKLLLAYGADYEKEDFFGEKPMYTSVIKRPDLRCLLVLLRVGADPEYRNNTGMSLLSRAILQCSTFEIIKVLIRFGAAVNSQDAYSSKTPLHFAAMINDVKITKYLLAHGANPNITTVYNFTPFDEAVFHKNLEVAEVLLKYTKKAKVRELKALRTELIKEERTE